MGRLQQAEKSEGIKNMATGNFGRKYTDMNIEYSLHWSTHMEERDLKDQVKNIFLWVY